jgi:transcriptional antiterminator NusG
MIGAMASGVQPETLAIGDLSRAAERGDAPWWVAHTRSRHEKALADELARMGVFCYLPLCRRVTRSRATQRVSRSIVPVFPGYLFFVADEEQRYRVLRTNHVARTLPVPDAATLIRQLRQVDLAVRSGEPIARSARLAAGDRVRVVAGPLVGLEGVVTRWRSRLRIVLNVEILGQSASVEVDADLVERADL